MEEFVKECVNEYMRSFLDTHCLLEFRKKVAGVSSHPVSLRSRKCALKESISPLPTVVLPEVPASVEPVKRKRCRKTTGETGSTSTKRKLDTQTTEMEINDLIDSTLRNLRDRDLKKRTRRKTIVQPIIPTTPPQEIIDLK